ncbi:MAG: LPS export ABC transporter periplasmic protein LptC [Hyphomicrobiales bacterium]|nr:LPS export ABC transporter periplasmic protein LptC [Hyphomicrobiales bacterium]
MTFRNGAIDKAIQPGVGSAPRVAHPRARHIAIVPPPDREEAFVRARRRSARVRFLRKAILVGGLGSVVAMVGSAVFNPFMPRTGALSFSALSLDGTKITMARPKLTGFRPDGQPFSMTAEKALQDIKNPAVVELKTVTGEVGASSGETTRISADAGVYDSAGEHMQLFDNVRISNSRFEVRLRKADIDFKTGVYESDEPVEAHVGQGTTIFGDRGSARNNGQEFTFEGHVRTRIVQPADTAGDAAAKGANP